MLCLILGLLTFFSFIDAKFLQSNKLNLQTLLIADLILVVLFFVLILVQIFRLFKNKNGKEKGSKANLRYISFFSAAILLPSVLISVFSLVLFSVGLQKYFDKKIQSAVNNSYDIAKSYVLETKNTIQTDVLLVSLDINRNINLFYDDRQSFKNTLRSQRFIRRLDEVHLVDGSGNFILSSTSSNSTEFLPVPEKAFDMLTSENLPIIITDPVSNRSSSLLKLDNFIDTYLYVVKFLDPKIINYLKDTEQAVSFYYTVENSKTGIKITFALIYIIIVTLLLFISISISIRFASRFFKPIANLIGASQKISSGNLNARVPIIEADDEIDKLNKNFNSMIDKLKSQQEKLLTSERHEAWESVARKLAHEIKNPLTPIQLSTDRLKQKYSAEISSNKNEFQSYLMTINRQIKEIEHLVDEFSDFARMPKPVLKNTNLKEVVNEAINLHALSNDNIKINFSCKKEAIIVNADVQQLNRVFINLIKNSIESINEKTKKEANFAGKIDIEIKEKDNYIYFRIDDNGTGFTDKDLNKIVKPYFTTKTKGTGLGLSIVNKIINDHDGKIYFKAKEKGARVEIILSKNAN